MPTPVRSRRAGHGTWKTASPKVNTLRPPRPASSRRRRCRDPDHRCVQGWHPSNLERGVTEGEHSSVRRDEPVATAVRGGGDPTTGAFRGTPPIDPKKRCPVQGEHPPSAATTTPRWDQARCHGREAFRVRKLDGWRGAQPSPPQRPSRPVAEVVVVDVSPTAYQRNDGSTVAKARDDDRRSPVDTTGRLHGTGCRLAVDGQGHDSGGGGSAQWGSTSRPRRRQQAAVKWMVNDADPRFRPRWCRPARHRTQRRRPGDGHRADLVRIGGNAGTRTRTSRARP